MKVDFILVCGTSDVLICLTFLQITLKKIKQNDNCQFIVKSENLVKK
jgi:hypothetical protein